MGRLPALILASGSPQRRKLLKDARIAFAISPSRVSERSAEKNPRARVTLLAVRKAVSVARKNPGKAVLGADTMVVCKGRILGKPRGLADALGMLRLQNGSWQKVYTGVAVALDGGKRVFKGAAVSRVKARRLPDAELARLAAKHMDKAGAYAVQDSRDPFIEKVEGARDNVIGLPVALVRTLLKRAAPAGRHQ
jgi:septum formation protein